MEGNGKLNIQIVKKKLIDFKKDISELVKIKNKYADCLSQLRPSSEKKIVRFEYSKGGETLHRGYYCPSPVLDLIVGNSKRGRILKRKPDFGKFSHEYGFDAADKLIRVRGVSEFTTPNSNYDKEYLIYLEDVVYGVQFNNMSELDCVSKCPYTNGNILKYEMNHCVTEQSADLHLEEHTYTDNKLSEVTVFMNITPFNRTV
jgi:hypothetical protein